MHRILFTLRLLTALATVTIIVLLCMQCIDIYMDGNAPEMLDINGVYRFSVFRIDDVASRWRRLAVPLISYALLAAVTGMMHHVYVKNSFSIAADITPENRLRLIKSRISRLSASALREEKMRRWIKTITAGIAAVCGIVALSYLLNGDNFISWDLELVMGKMMIFIFPWMLVAFAAACIASIICKQSILREIEALQSQGLLEQAAKPINRTHAISYIRFLIFVLAVVFIVLGVINGGLYDVLVKAINICTECIGLG